MVQKLALASLFFNSSETSQSSSLSAASFSTAASWQWPSCTQARTLSFRVDSAEIVSMRHHDHKQQQEEYKTSMNPAYVLDSGEYYSCSFSDSSEKLSTAPEAAIDNDVADEDEVIVRSLRSNGRLFFEPESTSSIVNVKAATAAAFDGATALAIDSADPYGDFRRSMEEMVLSHGVNDWGWLEEMLGWYLSANGKKTHGLIVGAFVDLLVALASAPSPACSSSFKGLQPVKKGKHLAE
uniref:Transcription repressor n=1 Tax=Arundo donax TaxID=35708 RepID=A0A0A9A491_ARUDO